jgi:hypothetical protein
MRRPAALLALAAALAAAPAAADDALIDVGTTLSAMRISLVSNQTIPATGFSARFMFVDGHGEVALGGRIGGWKPLWGEYQDNMGFDLEFMAMFGGRFKGRKAHIMPCGGFAAGLRNLFLEAKPDGRQVASGLGIRLHLGVHGYFGDDSGFYWRLAGFGAAHLLFPEPGWTAEGGAELTIGIYMD